MFELCRDQSDERNDVYYPVAIAPLMISVDHDDRSGSNKTIGGIHSFYIWFFGHVANR